MSITVRELILLADHLREVKPPKRIVDAICKFCRASNPRFKEGLFRDYLKGICGPEGGKR